MLKYSPLHISGYKGGLIQSRQNFLIPNDAYPVLNNAFVWRERIKRKQGAELLGRLRRLLTGQALGKTDAAGAYSNTLITALSLESTAQIEPGSLSISDGVNTFTDTGTGFLLGIPAGTGTVNYSTTAITISGAAIGAPLTASFNYFPTLPVMGIRSQELNNTNNERTLIFDTKYCYRYGSGGYQEYITGTTWTGNNSDFFWSTNYWVNSSNAKLFWVTNFSGTSGDYIRYTDGTTWTLFGATSPTGTGLIDGTNYLNQCLALLPFRGRLVAFNTYEGTSLGASVNYPNRIRWAAIGNPLDVGSAGPPLVPGAWRDDRPGKGGFLDIPTSQSIISVGFVRDNLVIYCERSTWQLRYTGQAIAPFQIERVNSELGAESTFSAVQFDTSLMGIGDKGIVECDSFKSRRVDEKIPDLVFTINNDNDGTKRVHGIRDFYQRLAYWIYPDADSDRTFPDKRLVYNYDNDTWATFDDSFTAIGTYQPTTGRTWASVETAWSELSFPWINRPNLIPQIIAGNQQGYIQILDQQVTNEQSLTITDITGNTTSATLFTSANHNLKDGQIVVISDIPTGTPFDDLNGVTFMIDLPATNPQNTFFLMKYNSVSKNFTDYRVDVPATYVGGGQISVKDNFTIQSKKFSYSDEGQNIMLGYMDVLMSSSSNGSISVLTYVNYNDENATNIMPQNDNGNGSPDTFFNSVIPTDSTVFNFQGSSKNWHRVYNAVKGSFFTIVWTLSPEQMQNESVESQVEFDAQVLWIRKAGTLSF